MRHNIVVDGAAGRRAFTGWEVPGMRDLPPVDSRGPLTVVVHDDGTPYGYPVVVPVSTVTELSTLEQEALIRLRAYRAEWSVKTGRPESQVYVPVALRPASVPQEAW